jgi:hypothetical protein
MSKQARLRLDSNPTNAVGGSFILGLQARRQRAFENPTNAVGGSFIPGLYSPPPFTLRLIRGR